MIRLFFLTLLLNSVFNLNAQKLVGISRGGGVYQRGTIFQFDVTSNQFEVLHDFDTKAFSNSSRTPALVEGKNGKLFGINQKDSGAIISFNLKTKVLSNEYYFSDSITGFHPTGTLFKNSDSTFLGVCRYGGINGKGTLYSFNPFLGEVRKLIDFDSTTSFPEKGLEHYKGDVYIASSPYGGAYNQGALIKLDIGLGTAEVLLDFSDSTTGTTPIAIPKIASNGSVYIPTSKGKAIQIGNYSHILSVVEYDIENDSLIDAQVYSPWYFGVGTVAQFIEVDSVLYNASMYDTYFMRYYLKDSVYRPRPYVRFPENYGEAEEIMLASDGLIYGATSWGGPSGRGVIFSYSPQTDSIKLLHDITFSEGNLGKSKLIELSKCAGVNRSIGYSGQGLISGESNASYQWIDCNAGTIIQGETEQIFIPQDTGSYAVEVRKGGCKDTSWCINVLTVGIEEIGFSGQIALSPNPTSNNVQLQLPKTTTLEVKVRNLQGKLLSTQNFTNQKQVQISLNQNSGIYFLEISNAAGEKVFKKVVKQ